MIMQTLQIAALIALVSPLIIVGTGVLLGLILSISQMMMGVVVGMMVLFRGMQEPDWGDDE